MNTIWSVVSLLAVIAVDPELPTAFAIWVGVLVLVVMLVVLAMQKPR